MLEFNYYDYNYLITLLFLILISILAIYFSIVSRKTIDSIYFLSRYFEGSLDDIVKFSHIAESCNIKEEKVKSMVKRFIRKKLMKNYTVDEERSQIKLSSKMYQCECKNCGMSSKLKDFVDGCPYCGTYYNIDYTDKDLGGKYHYDRVLRKKTYRVITAIIDLVISLILSFIFIKYTSRTFNSYDISKIFIYGTILSLILYYLFYIMDAYVILGPIKRFKDKQNKKQMEFWDRTKIDKKTFFNNLNYEVGKKYYLKEDIIDYDILDYLDFKEFRKNYKLYVSVKADVRIVYLKNNKIKSKFIEDTYVLLKHNNKTIELKDGANMIKCPNCGASVDVKNGYCEYCNSKIGYLQEWIIED